MDSPRKRIIGCRRSQRGFTIVEFLIAGVMAATVLVAAHVLLLNSFEVFSVVSVRGKTHSDFLALRETLARDVRHAAAIVAQITLDGTIYQTEMGPVADSFVVRLPATDVNGDTVPSVYDFVVYTTQTSQAGRVSLIRTLFTSRDDTGLPVQGQGSTRRPDSRVMVREILAPQADGTVAPLFSVDQPVIEVARQVALTITLDATESTSSGRKLPQTFVARFRLRNI